MAGNFLQRGNAKAVIFIDIGIADWQSLFDGAPEGAEIVTLDPTRDGLEQMAQWAQTHSGYDAIHIISHGSKGQIHLGNFTLDASAINLRASDLAQLGAALNEEGDLLLYGCEVASGEGQDFITALAQATQADVAASDDLTGATSKGGDWVLEAVSSEGAIQTQAFSAQDFLGALSTIAFDGAVQNGNFAVTVTEQGRTIEVTTTGITNYFSPIDAGGVGGSTGYIIGDINAYGLTSVTFSFDVAVDVSSIQFVEIEDMAAGNYIFTSNDSQTASVAANSSTDIGGFHGIPVSSLNFTNIISFNVTYSEGQFAPGFDNLVFEVSSTNAAPTITDAPSDITAFEDTASNVDLSGVTLADSDGDNLTVTLTASAGTLAASSGGSVAVSGSGSGALTLSGTAANINTYLDTTTNIQYTGASNASGDNAATLTIKANDGSVDSSTTTANVDITSVDNAATFDFETGVTGLGTNTVTAVATNATFTITGSDAKILDSTDLDPISNSTSLVTGFDEDNNYYETSYTFTIDSGKTFDLSSIKIQNWSGGNDETFVLTSSKGSVDFTLANGNLTTLIDVTSDPNASNLQGISSFKITDQGGDGFYIYFDDLVVTNVTTVATNAAPTITGAPADITVTEDTASNVDLSDVTFSDSDGDNLTVTLTASSGTLAASSGGSVTVSGSGSGALTLVGTAANINTYLDTTTNIQYTGATNASGGNAARLTITANDGSVDSSTTTVNVDITAVNDAPVFTSSNNASVAENTTAVTTLVATDADADTLTYSISGGADQALFSLDSNSGALTFSNTPDFETPGDNNGDNVYAVEVTANDDHGGTTPLTLAVTVADANEAPALTGGTQANVSENSTGTIYTATGSDPENNPLTYALGGTDALLFDLNANSGALSFKTAPDFEAPGDAGGNNVYDVILTANDGSLNSNSQALTITVTDVNDANHAPVFTSSSKTSVAENTTVVTTLIATDADSDTVVYSIIGGADQTLFSLDANSGALSFITAPDFEAPNDQGKDNQYELVVEADDGVESVSQTLFITVTDVNETQPPSPGPGPDPIQVAPAPGEPLPDMPSGQPSVSETISNNGATPGSVRLVENTGNNNVVTATLPGRVTLVHEGARTATDRNLAMEDLIVSIDGKTPTNLSDQTSLASQWLASRPEGTFLDIRTLTFSGTATSSDPIVLMGTDSGNGAVSNQEAFVIDVSGLTQGNQIQLDNIDFASIVGATTIRGGAGNNVVIGDDASQYIVLGAGDDELHGGGGDDTIGSEGGNDRLFGDSGDDELFGGAGADLLHGGSDIDTVSYQGNRNDYVVTQEHSVITVQSKEDPEDIDTLINVESLIFADDELVLNYDEDLAWITGLYAQVLGRQGDVDGVQYWTQRQAEGLSKADIAPLFITSSEAGGRLDVQGDGIDGVVNTLYGALLGREADAPGRVYWTNKLESGISLHEVVGGFMDSEEIRMYDMIATQWAFIV